MASKTSSAQAKGPEHTPAESIIRDMRKSMIVSAVILAVLIGCYIALINGVFADFLPQ